MTNAEAVENLIALSDELETIDKLDDVYTETIVRAMTALMIVNDGVVNICENSVLEEAINGECDKK